MRVSSRPLHPCEIRVRLSPRLTVQDKNFLCCPSGGVSWGMRTRAFEIFPGRGLRAGAQVTIYSNGRISLSVSADTAVGSPTHVVFLYDKDAEVAGLKPSSNEAPYAYEVKRLKTTCPHVNCSRFVRVYGIRQGVYSAKIEDGILIFETATPLPIRTGRRKVRANDA